MKKLIYGRIWTLATRVEGKHANRYTTVVLHVYRAENKHNTTFAVHNKTRSIEHWKYQRNVDTTNLNNYYENFKVWLRIEIYKEIEFFK